MPKTWAMCLVLLVSCKGDDKPGMASEVEAGGATDVEAEDTARTVTRLFPIRCEAGHADWDWAGCHDEAVGYAKVLECAMRNQARAAAAKARLPTSEVAQSPCGRIVEKAVRDQAEATDRYMGDMVAWLKGSKTLLARKLSGKSLTDGCDGDCPGKPESFAPAYERKSIGEEEMACTKALFECGPPKGNVCFVGKVAARLGAACNPAENHTDSPLFASATGRRLAAP